MGQTIPAIVLLSLDGNLCTRVFNQNIESSRVLESKVLKFSSYTIVEDYLKNSRLRVI